MSRMDAPKDAVDIRLNIDTTALTDEVKDLVIQYLEGLELDDDIEDKEAVMLTLWDFAGQHVYYASHPVFLSTRAIYLLVYNLSKNLSDLARPRFRQGIYETSLDNPNGDTNLDELMAWLVSLNGIRRATAGEEVNDPHNLSPNLPYLRPPVLIVGTHADQPFDDPEKMRRCIQRAISGKTYERHVIQTFFTVDNTKSQSDEGVQRLKKKIMEVLKLEPYMGEEVPLRYAEN